MVACGCRNGRRKVHSGVAVVVVCCCFFAGASCRFGGGAFGDEGKEEDNKDSKTESIKDKGKKGEDNS